jgi:DNA-binding beta-propeller fold protein YncE
MFISRDNMIYVAASSLNRLLVFKEGSSNFTMSYSTGSRSPHSVFLSMNGDVYMANSYPNFVVERWTANASNSTLVMYTDAPCFGLFIDIHETLYCSMDTLHRVIKRSLTSYVNVSTTIAGTSASGSAQDQLSEPSGIFVDQRRNLYVADCGNHRIQLFQPDQSNATTVAGLGAPNTIVLRCPRAIVLDANAYMFITDSTHHRIVASGPNGFRCIAGCQGVSGSAANQLQSPSGLSFDSYGHLYVLDQLNSRIQKFVLLTNRCGKRLELI